MHFFNHDRGRQDGTSTQNPRRKRSHRWAVFATLVAVQLASTPAFAFSEAVGKIKSGFDGFWLLLMVVFWGLYAIAAVMGAVAGLYGSENLKASFAKWLSIGLVVPFIPTVIVAMQAAAG